MATVKIKWRPLIIEGKIGTIYYRIIHNRVLRQLKIDYKVFAEELSDAHGVLVISSEDRSGILASIKERVAWDLKRLNAIIEWFNNRILSYNKK